MQSVYSPPIHVLFFSHEFFTLVKMGKVKRAAKGVRTKEKGGRVGKSVRHDGDGVDSKVNSKIARKRSSVTLGCVGLMQPHHNLDLGEHISKPQLIP
jgi:hypothetical protein